MKRYYTDNLSLGPVADDEEVHCVYARADIQSHARTLLAVVERLRHCHGCASDMNSWNREIGRPEQPCNCPLGELRRGLEVMIK